MRTDELRREIAAMADDVESFSGDVQTLHRKVRRSRILSVAAVCICVALLAVAVVTAAAQHKSSRVHVATVPDKEIGHAEMRHIDAFVIPATPAAKNVLNASPLVARYALVPHADRGDMVTAGAWLCALQTMDGYAVDATSPGTDLRAPLARALGTSATVYDVSNQLGSDAEIFLKLGASPAQVAAIRAALLRDPDVASMTFLDVNAAYAVFAEEFANQPALVHGTKPSDLPESFRILLKSGRSRTNLARRYELADGVDNVILPDTAALWSPRHLLPAPAPAGAPCKN